MADQTGSTPALSTMRLRITLIAEPEIIDRDDPTGVTEDAYNKISAVLMEFGWDMTIDIDNEEDHD